MGRLEIVKQEPYARWNMKTYQMIALWVIGIFTVCAAMYGMYWIAKTFSYWLFYGDMVEQTINEMVKKSCLK